MKYLTSPWLFGVVVAVVCAATVFAWLRRPDDVGVTYASKTITVGQQRLQAQIADTDKKRELGLGQRDALANGQGMLFVNDSPSSQCFWMKDMRFSIDMVWLDAGKRIVQVRDNVAPDTYPTTFCAPDDKPAQYVLEVASGQAKPLGLRPGVQVSF